MFAGVDDEADARDSDGSFGDVGCNDDLACEFGRGLEDALLEVRGQSSVEREDEKRRQCGGEFGVFPD